MHLKLVSQTRERRRTINGAYLGEHARSIKVVALLGKDMNLGYRSIEWGNTNYQAIRAISIPTPPSNKASASVLVYCNPCSLATDSIVVRYPPNLSIMGGKAPKRKRSRETGHTSTVMPKLTRVFQKMEDSAPFCKPGKCIDFVPPVPFISVSRHKYRPFLSYDYDIETVLYYKVYWVNWKCKKVPAFNILISQTSHYIFRLLSAGLQTTSLLRSTMLYKVAVYQEGTWLILVFAATCGLGNSSMTTDERVCVGDESCIVIMLQSGEERRK